jgi:PTS system cellobiose-specific IIC component
MSEATEGKLDRFLKKVLPAVQSFQSNTYISAVTEGMMGSMTVLMASAIFQLIYAFPIDPWTQFLKGIGLYDLLVVVVNICNMTALFITFAIGYKLGEKKGVDPFQTGFASLLAFLIITPLVTDDAGNTLINVSYFGAKGIFTAMLCGLVAPSLFAFCIDRHIEISLPDSVPAFVSKSLGPIPSSLVSIVPFVCLRGIFGMTSWGSLTDFIYAIIQTPLTGLGNTLAAHLICIALCCLLWWCGIHGTLVVFGVMMAIWTPSMLENLAAYNAGQPIPYILSLMSFFMIVQFMGGPGCLFGLYLDLAFTTKSERYKAQGKISLVPGIFNIIEPTVFGLPIVLNPVLLVPFVGLPVVMYLLYYFLASAGIIGIPVLNLQVMVIPGPIAGFLLGGGISLGIFCLLGCVLSAVVYYPFVQILDKQELKAEQQRKNEELAATEK